MNMANTGLTAWYPLDEAAEVISRHTGANIHRHDLLGAALATRLPLVVCVPNGTTDSEGQPIDDGLWDLLVEGSRGRPARQQLAYEISPDIPNSHARRREGRLGSSIYVQPQHVDGMWVEKDGQYRQLRPAGYPVAGVQNTRRGLVLTYASQESQCVLGVLETVLDDFAETVKDRLPHGLA